VTQTRPIRRIATWLPLAGVLLAAGCTRTDVLTVPPAGSTGKLPALETRPITAPTLSSLKASAPTIASCAAATVYPLTDGNRTVGSVSVSNDASNIYVTYATPTQYWWIANTQLEVTNASASVPRDASGNASPWDFNYSGEHTPPITSVTYTVPLTTAGVKAGQTAYVSAMAGLEHPVTESEAGLEGAWEWIVMWGVGSTSSTSTEVIHSYTVASCGGTVTPPTPPPSTSGGVITITFDDGFATTYTNAYPVLKGLGLVADAAVNPTPIDEGWGDYMTPPQVRELSANGWAIVSHTMDHADLTTLSAGAMEAEIRDSKAWIVKNNYGPASMFVVPFHAWGARERAMVAKYHTYARGHTIDEWSPAQYTAWPITQPLDIYAFEPEFAPYKTASGRALTMSKIKYAVDNGKYLDLMFHTIPVATLPQFKDLMTQIASTYMSNVRTYKDIAK
jgi:peptidoglycan/xylan/chitin deacetylase (PgdA/CDA1 family)